MWIFNKKIISLTWYFFINGNEITDHTKFNKKQQRFLNKIAYSMRDRGYERGYHYKFFFVPEEVEPSLYIRLIDFFGKILLLWIFFLIFRVFFEHFEDFFLDYLPHNFFIFLVFLKYFSYLHLLFIFILFFLVELHYSYKVVKVVIKFS